MLGWSDAPGRVRSDFAVESAGPVGIGSHDAACVIWTCDDGYHPV